MSFFTNTKPSAAERANHQIQRTQAQILQRLDRLEAILSQGPYHFHSLVSHINTMASNLNEDITALNLNQYTYAKDRAFEVTEILEAILLHLPLRDLLFMQRVNTHFKSVIEASPKLQRALFFQPDFSQGSVELNPLLANRKFFHKTNPIYFEEHDRPILCGYEPESDYPEVLFLKDIDVCRDKDSQQGQHVSVIFSEYMPHQDTGFGFYERFMKKERIMPDSDAVFGSWKKMYLSQPPSEVVWLVDRGRPHRTPVTGRLTGGLKFLPLFQTDESRAWLAQQEDESHARLLLEIKGDLKDIKVTQTDMLNRLTKPVKENGDR